MSDLKRIFTEKASSADDIAERLLARADAGKSRYTADEMFLLVAAARIRSRNLSQDDREALWAVNDGEARSVRMLNLLAKQAGSDKYFTDEAATKKPMVAPSFSLN